MTPLQRTLAHLREQGYVVDITERFVPTKAGGFRKDLFGLWDCLCLHRDYQGCLGVQATTMAHFADHREKLQSSAMLPLWLKAGNRARLYGWAKRGALGKRKVWTATVEELYG